MTTLSISRAWNETAAFVAREARLLFPIAFLLVALPAGILQLMAPSPTATPAEQVQAVLLLLPLALLAGILGLIGTIALSYLALRPGASVGEALQVGGRRFIMLFAAWLLIGLGMVAALIPLFVVAALLGGAGGRIEPTSGAAVIFILLLLIYLAGFVALWVRLLLMAPVAAVENAGPIEIIRRSWDLTREHFWKLLGLVLLLILAALVVLFAVSTVAGILIILVAGPPQPGSGAMILLILVSALIQSAVSMIFATLAARLYAQLSGEDTPRVFT